MGMGGDGAVGREVEMEGKGMPQPRKGDLRTLRGGRRHEATLASATDSQQRAARPPMAQSSMRRVFSIEDDGERDLGIHTNGYRTLEK